MKMSNKKFIKKMDDYFDKLSEAFDNPLDIKWIDNDDILRGLFTINDNIYQIVCENKDNNIWKYDFYFYEKDKKFSPELTGFEKDKFRVLPTIENGIEYLYNNKKVDCIIFGASDKSKGRKKLYTAFCEKFCEKNNLEFYTTKDKVKINARIEIGEKEKRTFFDIEPRTDKDNTILMHGLSERVIKIIKYYKIDVKEIYKQNSD
jgi:hypothetical protein